MNALSRDRLRQTPGGTSRTESDSLASPANADRAVRGTVFQINTWRSEEHDQGYLIYLTLLTTVMDGEYGKPTTMRRYIILTVKVDAMAWCKTEATNAPQPPQFRPP